MPGEPVKPKGKTKKPAKRTIRTKALAKKLIDGLTNGIPLRQLCRENGVSKGAVYNWFDADASLAGLIAQARARGFEDILDSAMEIADEPPARVITFEGGKTTERTDSGAVRHQALRIDTRLKLLAKWDPKRYGELLKLGNADGSNIDLSARIEEARARAKQGTEGG
jgi:AcrR family transcriptional regulator